VVTGLLRTSRPSEQGVDARGVLAFVDALESTPNVDPHSLILLRHGHIVAQGWWAPYAPARPHLLYSLSKSFTSTAVGLAVAEGLLSLDDTVLSYFPELDADITDPRSRRMRVRDIAAMASGHLTDAIERAGDADPADLVRGFLLVPPDADPGTVFAYNQPCTFALGAIVARASGQTLTEYLGPRLFEPLGITDVGWQRDASGRELAYSGLYTTTDAVARLGLLYLQRGMWEGEQLLSPRWVEQATSRQVDNAQQNSEPDWQQGYGFQFWLSRHGYRGDGAYGQFCVVLPEHDVVLAMTGGTRDMQAVLDAAWQHLLPALATAGPSSAQDELAARLAHLALPTVRASASPAPDWHGFKCATTGPGPLTSVGVARTGAVWQATLGDDDSSVVVDLGDEGWAESAPDDVPLAISGGWTDPRTLRFDVVFTETPHRLQVTCDLSEVPADTRWVTEPLHSLSLSQLRSPRR